jgi:hypothetical protein
VTGFLTAKQLAEKFPLANLSALPTSNPGGGKPWLRGDGAIGVGAYTPATVTWNDLAGLLPLDKLPAHNHDDRYARLSGGNTLSGDQVVSGNVTASGTVSATTGLDVGGISAAIRVYAVVDSNAPRVGGVTGGVARWEVGGSSSNSYLVNYTGGNVLLRGSNVQARNASNTDFSDFTAANVTANGNLSSTSTIRVAGGSGLFLATDGSYNSGFRLQTLGNGQARLTNHAGSSGVQFDIVTADTLTLRNLAGTALAAVACSTVQNPSGNLNLNSTGIINLQSNGTNFWSVQSSTIYPLVTAGSSLGWPGAPSWGSINEVAMLAAGFLNFAGTTRLSQASSGVLQVGTNGNNASGSLLATNLTASGLINNLEISGGWNANSGTFNKTRIVTGGGAFGLFVQANHPDDTNFLFAVSHQGTKNPLEVFRNRTQVNETLLVSAANNSGRLEVRNGSGGNLIVLGDSGTGNVTINNSNSVGGAISLQAQGTTQLWTSSSGVNARSAFNVYNAGSGNPTITQRDDLNYFGLNADKRLVWSSSTGSQNFFSGAVGLSLARLDATTAAFYTTPTGTALANLSGNLISGAILEVRGANNYRFDVSGTNGRILNNSSGVTNLTFDSSGNVTVGGFLTSGFRSLSANPTTLDIASGLEQLVLNTTNNELRRWANVSGTMRSVLYA